MARKPDNKCTRRKFLKTEEVKQYEKASKNKNSMQESLDRLGYKKEEDCIDRITYLAW